jgi:hypothetical protein
MVRGVVAGLLAAAVVVGTVLVRGPADLAGSYAVLLVLAVLGRGVGRRPADPG